jgi:PAS domain S-box-containing protein
MDVSSEIILIIDPATLRYIDANRAACRDLGYTREELLHIGPEKILPASRAELAELYRRLIAGDPSDAASEDWYRRKDGSRFPVESRQQAIRTGRGHLVVAAGRDVSEHRRIKDALRESEERYRGLSALSADVHWEQDEQLRFTSLSRADSSVFEPWRIENLIGKRRWESGYINLTEADWAAHRALLEARQPFRDLELCHYDSAGRKIWIRVSGEPVFDASGAFKGYRGIARDFTERRRAEELRELEHSVTRILSEADSASAALKAVFRAVCETEGWECGRYFHLDEQAGVLRFADGWSVPDPSVEHFLEISRDRVFLPGEGLSGLAWQTGRPLWSADVTKDPRTESGSLKIPPEGIGMHGAFVFPVVLGGKPIGVFNFASRKPREPEEQLVQAITSIGRQIGQFLQRRRADEQRRVLERQLRQAHKMEAIGTLATGMAHEFNNVLRAILANVELARMDMDPEDPARLSVEQIERASRRASDFVRRILAFARPQAPQRRRLALGEIAQEVVRLMRATVPSRIQITVETGRGAPEVLADATQIHQLLVNLCTNACQAMEDRSGKIVIGVSDIASDGAAMRRIPGIQLGRFAQLTVRDSGSGIDPAIRDRIFDPFFSTKRAGEGTGLGLAVVSGIVQAHEGFIDVESRPGDGATFYVYLPAAQESAAQGPEEEVSSPARGRGRRVLFLDDDAELVSAQVRTLSRCGYAASGHTVPETALDAFRAEPGEYDVLVSDYKMPGMSGLELAREALCIRSDLPVIIVSGHVDDALRCNARDLGVQLVLEKPHKLEELLAAIDRVTGNATAR